jgi:hypothetical protein
MDHKPSANIVQSTTNPSDPSNTGEPAVRKKRPYKVRNLLSSENLTY